MSDLQNRLDISLRQTVQLSQTMLQSIRILQMGTAELRDYIREQMEENPFLEENSEPPAEGYFDLRYEYRSDTAVITSGEDDSRDFFRDSLRDRSEEETLKKHLLDQLAAAGTEAQTASLCRYLIFLLDEDGFLDPGELSELSAASEIGSDLLERAMSLLRSFDPAGVGAADIEDCLCLQLQRLEGDHSIEEKIIRSELSGLAQGHYGAIAARLRITAEDVRRAAECIRSLTPHPGAAFSSQEDGGYIIPDLTVIPGGDPVQIVCNIASFPQLRMNDYYCSLKNSAPDTETQAFLRRNEQNASFLLDALTRREQTVVKCSEIILRRQLDFFLGKSKTLRPLSLRDIASATGLHEATVSRAIAGKYISCPQGCFPLKFFLARSSGGEQISRNQVAEELKKLVAEENPSRPLSDQALSDALKGMGFSVSRRTVTKYREQFAIPDSVSRRR